MRRTLARPLAARWAPPSDRLQCAGRDAPRRRYGDRSPSADRDVRLIRLDRDLVGVPSAILIVRLDAEEVVERQFRADARQAPIRVPHLHAGKRAARAPENCSSHRPRARCPRFQLLRSSSPSRSCAGDRWYEARVDEERAHRRVRDRGSLAHAQSRSRSGRVVPPGTSLAIMPPLMRTRVLRPVNTPISLTSERSIPRLADASPS